MGYSPWGRKVWDTTEHAYTHALISYWDMTSSKAVWT